MVDVEVHSCFQEPTYTRTIVSFRSYFCAAGRVVVTPTSTASA